MATRGLTLTDVLPVDRLGDRRNVLVAGPNPSAVSGVPESILGAVATDRDGGVMFTTRDPGQVAADRLAGVDGLDGDRIGVVDATQKSGGMASRADGRNWQVPSPTDLTGSAIALEECLDALDRHGAARCHVLYDSLSTPLVSTESTTVLQYAHQLTFQRGGREGLAVFPVYTNMTTDRDLEFLKHLFDGLVSVRRRGGTRQVRCRGFEGAPDGWTTLDAPGRDRAPSLSD